MKVEEEKPNIDNNFISKIMGESKEEYKEREKEDKTIKQWLYENGKGQFNNKKDIDELIFKNETINIKYKEKLAIICDSPEYLLNIGEKDINIDDIIEIRCENILKLIKIEKIEKNGEFENIKKAIKSVWFEAFKKFVDEGTKVTYFSINRLLIKIKYAFNTNNNIISRELSDMLLYGLAKGCHLDIEQLNIISIANKELENDVKKVYELPYWKKICGNNDKEIPENLKKLAFNLNIDFSENKEIICDNLNLLNSIPDKKLLKESAVNRQQKRISDDVSSISNFINGPGPLLNCINNSESFEYADYYVSYYKDAKDNLWCFLSNMYESLLKSGINPNNNEVLPDMFLKQIFNKLKELKELNIPINNPKKISDIIDELSLNDSINNIESDYIVNTIFTIASLNGINSESIKNLNNLQMNELLKYISIDQSDTFLLMIPVNSEKILNTTVMTYNHLLVTFCRAIYYRIKNDTYKSNQFFTILKSKIK